MSLFIGIDSGTQSVKAVVLDLDAAQSRRGGTRAAHADRRPARRPHGAASAGVGRRRWTR